jgi:hypothetical protein
MYVWRISRISRLTWQVCGRGPDAHGARSAEAENNWLRPGPQLNLQSRDSQIKLSPMNAVAFSGQQRKS